MLIITIINVYISEFGKRMTLLCPVNLKSKCQNINILKNTIKWSKWPSVYNYLDYNNLLELKNVKSPIFIVDFKHFNLVTIISIKKPSRFNSFRIEWFKEEFVGSYFKIKLQNFLQMNFINALKWSIWKILVGL